MIKVPFNRHLFKGIFFLFAILSMTQCRRSSKETLFIDPAFTEKISAFTSGTISSESTIQIILAEDYKKPVTVNTAISEDLFQFKPKIKGNAVWVDKRTIEFRPEEKLKSGENYTAKFYLSKILDVPKKLSVFQFQFKIVPQSFSLVINGYQSYDNNNLVWNKIKGTVNTADVIDDDVLNKLFTARQGNHKLNMSWEISQDRRTFNFMIDSVQRKEKAEKVIVSWDGTENSPGLKGNYEVEIPALGDFKVMDVKVIQQPDQFIQIQFSDPIKKKQDFDGLIFIDNYTTLNYVVDGNIVKAYPSARQGGDSKLTVRKGVLNILGYELKDEYVTDITFELPKPAVRIAGKGVILPSSKGLIFPFEAVNLNAVDVKIIKIFENNVGYFLQVNKLDGSDQLKRAGRLIHKQTVSLTQSPVDLGKWNMFYLDLSKFIEPDPGSIYRVEISFKKKYSLYACDNDNEQTTEQETPEENYDESDDYEASYWDSYEDYYDEYYDEGDYDNDYQWSERDNPCSQSYYNQNRFVARNILASDLGIIVKSGNDKSMICAVTNLVTTEPLNGVEVSIYNFQQQVIATGKTDGNGLVSFNYDEKPFLLIAKLDKQRGYLRLDDGSSLSLSAFDVSGEVVQKGIKGFIYGERGVWRPGDTLFITFILEDKKKVLPENHPVIFELFNPSGQLITRTTKQSGQNGFYAFVTATDANAPTGNWNLKVKVGGAQFSKTLKIETVKPNRLKIGLDFGTDKISITDKNLTGKMAVTWLQGAVARDLRANVGVTLSEANTTFTKYPDYQFSDPSRKFNPEEHSVFDGHLDENGEASFPVSIEAEAVSPGMLNANFITRVFEEGGDFSIDRVSMTYSPYSSYVGIKTPPGDKRGMLLTDTTQWVDIVTVDDKGSPVSRTNLQAKVYKLDWRNWWESSNDDLANYVGNTYNSPVVTKTITTINGKGKFDFRINYPAWGRFYIRVYDPVSGHAAGKVVYIDWPGWAGRPLRENPEAATMLTFNSDKQKYNVGETAEITIPTGGQGRALVSIESGSRVLHAEWIIATDKETKYKFPVTAEMAPNVYVNVTLIQPHSSSANDMPMRLYGVIPLFVENPDTRLDPVINMPDVLEPEQKVTIQVSEKSGKEMTYTLAIVEDGLLDLTRFKTPDPWESFYAREALGVRTWDLYDMVIGAFGGKLESILSIGGDMEEQNKQGSEKANRFKPVVKYLGPFTLSKGKINSHNIEIPRYIGSVRTMVIAGNNGAYGYNEKTTPVRKPLMVLATLPRVLGPGESVKLPVTVFAMDKQVKDVTIQIKPNEFLLPQDEKTKTVTFNQTGDKVVNFNLKVASKLGVGKVQVVATSGKLSAIYDIELDIRTANPPVTTFIAEVVDAGKNWTSDFTMPGMEGTNTATLEVSNIPPLDLGRRLKYLIHYPYGCIEQTTSSVFPQLYLQDLMDLDNNTKMEIDKNIKAGIDRLKTFQLANGGFSYWPNQQVASDWGTSYAGHFLLEAEKKGYVLPVGFKSSWIKYQKRLARQWKIEYSNDYYYDQSDLEQAYRLYTLALAGDPEMSAMNRLREMKNLSLQAKWRLAATYALAGQQDIAKQLVAREATDIQPYKGFCSSYGSIERDWAMILETMTLLNDKPRAAVLSKKISDQLSHDYWMSTQTTAYCLMAMAKFAGNATSKTIQFNYKLNNGKLINVTTTKAIAEIKLPTGKKAMSGNISINNQGQGILFTRIVSEGIPEAGLEKEFSNNLSLSVTYRTLNGESIDVSKIEQGTDFLAVVTVYNPQSFYYKDMALSQIFPSGWEIHNTRLSDFESAYSMSEPTYQDIRDDRVYTYFDLGVRTSKTFVIQLNAAYLGSYYLPGVYCEAMYDNSISSLVGGKWVEVVSPGN